nr:MAG TPA: hypothetical protein [Caudoviricetes sp.]
MAKTSRRWRTKRTKQIKKSREAIPCSFLSYCKTVVRLL